jgi:predicted TPR repeat methyltransferase
MNEDGDAWLKTGYAHYEAGRWDEAADAIARALARQSGDPLAWYRLGNARQEQGRQQDAAACFERAVALDPAYAQAWNNLGVSRQALGQAAAAADAYRNAVRCDPALVVAHLNLGHLLSDNAEHAAAAAAFEQAALASAGRAEHWAQAARSWRRAGADDRAGEAFRKSLAADPAHAPAYAGLAGIAAARSDYAAAEDWYRTGLERCPGDTTLRHMLGALRGETSERPPAGYVAGLFDAMAHGFDRHLVGELDYRVPEELAALVRPLLGARAGRVLDLGCGTGLLGAALARPGLELTGVDLSGEMVREAGRRGIYARLVQADLQEELQRTAPGSLLAVLATDTFIYAGDLADIVAATAAALAPGGLFAFSIEHCDGAGYRLMSSGRYAHSLAYVQALAAKAGLAERQAVAAPLRREGDAYARGWLVILERPPSPPGARATGCS